MHHLDIANNKTTFNLHYKMHLSIVIAALVTCLLITTIDSCETGDVCGNFCTCTDSGSSQTSADCQNLKLANVICNYRLVAATASFNTVDYSNNNIKAITINDFVNNVTLIQSIETLNLASNEIAYINAGALVNLASLLTLQLQDNKLTSVESGVFNGLFKVSFWF